MVKFLQPKRAQGAIVTKKWKKFSNQEKNHVALKQFYKFSAFPNVDVTTENYFDLY
jgi:hypothetical protein